MKSTAREYQVLIFHGSGERDQPSSEIHAEIGGNFERFYGDFMDWLSGFHWYRKGRRGYGEAEKTEFRIHDRTRGKERQEDILVCCGEAEIIFSLLCCCEDHDVAVKEIRYRGNRYTDISNICFTDDLPFPDYWHVEEIGRAMIRLDAKKNGRDAQIYLFGPLFCYEDGNGAESVRIEGYPRSCSYGMVEIIGRRMYYAGTYVYHHNEDIPRDHDEYAGWQGCHSEADGVEVFLEIEDGEASGGMAQGRKVVFSALLNGELHRKISRDDEKVMFHSAVVQEALLDEDSFTDGSTSWPGFWECAEGGEDVVFQKNKDGRYQYTGGNGEAFKRWPDGIFTPPRTPDPYFTDEESAERLCREYMDAFCGRTEADLPAGKGLYDKFCEILRAVHNQYGLTAEEKEGKKGKKAGESTGAEEESVTSAEILYAACIFFSMEDKELEGFLTTEKMRATYGVLKIAAEEILNRRVEQYNKKANRKADQFVFREMREVFASDFAHINRLAYVQDNRGDYSEMPYPGDGMSRGEALDCQTIRQLVFLAGNDFLGRDGCYDDIFPIIQYYKTKIVEKGKSAKENEYEKQKAKRGSDAVIAMKKRLIEGLKESVKGQDMAVEKFVDDYVRYQLRGRTPGKPAGLYLFAGPPGTGKTYLAETFAKLKDVAGEGYRYKRFDMSAYGGWGGDSVSGLVGFEPSWKDAAPGQLTEFVKRNPKCVLLFDEIEKANPQVRLLFLSVMEGARLVDKFYDEEVSFEDAILIFTTNEGKEIYQDNRWENLTALPDSAVFEGLQPPEPAAPGGWPAPGGSKFPPELISRFMSGTVILFNYLDYIQMSNIFQSSVDAAVGQICNNWNLRFVPEYDDKLSKLYLMSKGGRIDARFVNANAKKMAEDYFLAAAEWMKERHPGKFRKLNRASVIVEVTDEVRKYFERPKEVKPRILIYAEGNAELSVGEAGRRRSRLSEKEPEPFVQIADCVLAGSAEEFQELFANCKWNSRDRKDKFDAVLIDLGRNPRIRNDEAGCQCLKAAAEAKRNIPIMVVDRGVTGERTPLFALGVTDFVQGRIRQQEEGSAGHGDREGEDLVLDKKELETIFDRQHFVTMAKELARKGKRLSGEAFYEYEEGRGGLEIRFANLGVKNATKEGAAARRQNKTCLLAERSQVRLDDDIFGLESVKEEVRLCIENIKHPEKDQEIGGKLMTGILMYGAPGMGKTMFANAMAFEANAYLISRAGSDLLHGDGVLEMERMFQTARRKGPCIIFIDEFDAISKSGDGRVVPAQEAVLAKFLKEMDGLGADNDGIYVVAETNACLEELDPAVTRRFSVRLHFPEPDTDERMRFLLWYLEKKNLGDILSEKPARILVEMMSGCWTNYSEIQQFVEQAMRQAASEDNPVPVTEEFLFDLAHDEKEGPVRPGMVYRQDVAHHEAGHAVLQYHYLKKVDYVTIVPRVRYNGYSRAALPPDTRQEFLERIRIVFAGRAAEMIYLRKCCGKEEEDGIHRGAGNDLQAATQVAYEYVCRYGLGDRIMVVPKAFAPETEGCPYPEAAVLPESEKKEIWASVGQILAREWEQTKQLLTERWDEVGALAEELFRNGRLSGREVENVIKSVHSNEDNPSVRESEELLESMLSNEDKLSGAGTEDVD